MNCVLFVVTQATNMLYTLFDKDSTGKLRGCATNCHGYLFDGTDYCVGCGAKFDDHVEIDNAPEFIVGNANDRSNTLTQFMIFGKYQSDLSFVIFDVYAPVCLTAGGTPMQTAKNALKVMLSDFIVSTGPKVICSKKAYKIADDCQAVIPLYVKALPNPADFNSGKYHSACRMLGPYKDITYPAAMGIHYLRMTDVIRATQDKEAYGYTEHVLAPKDAPKDEPKDAPKDVADVPINDPLMKKTVNIKPIDNNRCHSVDYDIVMFAADMYFSGHVHKMLLELRQKQ